MKEIKKKLSKRSILGLAGIILVLVFVLLMVRFSKGTGQNSVTTPAADITEIPSTEEAAPVAQPAQVKTDIYYGTLEASVVSEIIPEIRGQVLESPFRVGDKVNAGDLLIRIDDGGLKDSIALTLNSIAKNSLAISINEENLANLKVYSPADGILTDFKIREGERVNAGKLGEVVNQDAMTVKVLFNESQLMSITPGDKATLVSERYMGSIAGTVTAVYDKKVAGSDGSILYEVEIWTEDSEAFAEGTEVMAEINTSDGKLVSAAAGKMSYPEPASLMSKGSGNAKSIYARNGQRVSKGQLILEIENFTLEKTAQRTRLDRKDLEIRLEGLEKDLLKCTIHSPISGVVVAKDHEVLDQITSTSKSVMTVADISSLKMELFVEQDDLQKIREGKRVQLKAEDGAEIAGIVESVGGTGEQQNGELKYSVLITIPNENGLMPGIRASLDLSEQ